MVCEHLHTRSHFDLINAAKNKCPEVESILHKQTKQNWIGWSRLGVGEVFPHWTFVHRGCHANMLASHSSATVSWLIHMTTQSSFGQVLFTGAVKVFQENLFYATEDCHVRSKKEPHGKDEWLSISDLPQRANYVTNSTLSSDEEELA